VPADQSTRLESELDRRPRVLIVEDNQINRTVVEAILHKLGVQTAVAHNGREGIEMAGAHAYDAILMDCMMPEVDGFKATREIRKGERNHDVPIIAMTSMSMPGDRELCMTAGMDDYLSKPLRRAELDAAIHRWLPIKPPVGHQDADNDDRSGTKVT